jgi:hypothetical protein
MTERVLKTSVKQLLGVSSNTLLFGNAFSTDPSLLTQLDDVADAQPRSIRNFVDSLIERQAKIIEAAIQSQTVVYTANLRKRYQTCTGSKTSPTYRDDYGGSYRYHGTNVHRKHYCHLTHVETPDNSRNEVGSITESYIGGIGMH